MSRLAAAYGKEVYVVSKSGGIEPQLQEAMNLYADKLEGRHRFISCLLYTSNLQSQCPKHKTYKKPMLINAVRNIMYGVLLPFYDAFNCCVYHMLPAQSHKLS